MQSKISFCLNMSIDTINRHSQCPFKMHNCVKFLICCLGQAFFLNVTIKDISIDILLQKNVFFNVQNNQETQFVK